MQSGADAAVREVKANRNTTTGRAMVRQTDEMEEGETAALQRMLLKLQQKASNADSFSLWAIKLKKKLLCKC